jgi:predicted phosphodiesterase
MTNNSRRKTRAVILETDSEEEENDHDSASVKGNCDSSRRKQIQSTELEFEMKGEEGKAGDYLIFILICT